MVFPTTIEEGRLAKKRKKRRAAGNPQLRLLDVAPRQQCRQHDTCCAPLCPLDQQSLKSSVWHSDEEICSSRNFARILWIQKQKRIAKLPHVEEYFTCKMLRELVWMPEAAAGMKTGEKESSVTPREFSETGQMHFDGYGDWR